MILYRYPCGGVPVKKIRKHGNVSTYHSIIKQKYHHHLGTACSLVELCCFSLYNFSVLILVSNSALEQLLSEEDARYKLWYNNK